LQPIVTPHLGNVEYIGVPTDVPKSRYGSRVFKKMLTLGAHFRGEVYPSVPGIKNIFGDPSLLLTFIDVAM
jgi:hypothetical protein